MFCQKCGKENSDDAAFCNSCGANLTKKSALNAAYIHSKENEIRLLAEKFNHETSSTWPSAIGIALIGGLIGGLVGFLLGNQIIGIGIGVGFLYAANSWRSSKSNAARKTEIELKAAKSELEKMKNA